jgi:hypothetical protein
VHAVDAVRYSHRNTSGWVAILDRSPRITRVIRAAYLGENPGDLTSLVNPESIDEIRARR